MYLDRVELTNYRCFDQAEVILEHPRRSELRLNNLTLLLGVNGCGKSSLLQAIGLGWMGELIRDSGWVPRYQVLAGEKEAVVMVDGLLSAQDGGGRPLKARNLRTPIRMGTTTLIGQEGLDRFSSVKPHEDIGERFFDEKPGLFFAAYGTARRAASGARFDPDLRNKDMRLRFQRIASLYRPEPVDLVPLASWLPESKARAASLELLNELLPDELEPTEELNNGELLFSDRGRRVPYSALSDGYRSFLSWVGDLIFHLEMERPLWGSMVDVEGVCLVDEVDLHLHPDWQRRVVKKLTTTFPKLQFVVTTHSPLIVGTVDAANVRVFQRDQQGRATITMPDEETFGLSADQVLLSPYFGLSSVRAEAFEEQIQSVRKQAEAGDVEASIEYTRLLTLGAAGAAGAKS